MSYKVCANTTGGFDIKEIDTDATIVLKAVEGKARDLCRKLNLGAGFNGWTPAFMTEQFPLTCTPE